MKTLLSLILLAETGPTRLMLALAGAVWASILLMPGDTLVGSPYLRLLWVAPEWVWGGAFVAHTAGLLYCLWNDRVRPRAELVVHTAGVLLYSITATAAVVGNAGFLGHSAPQLTLALAALWVFARTAECPGLRDARDV